MTVYVLHFDPPYQHARHYVGYTPDASAERRIAEHVAGGAKGSPLVKAAIGAGSAVKVAHVFAGPEAGRDVEAWIKARRDVRSWCPLCGVRSRPLPNPSRMSGRFIAAKAF